MVCVGLGRDVEPATLCASLAGGAGMAAMLGSAMHALPLASTHFTI